MFKYQLSDMRFDQISDHKIEIYLYSERSIKLLAQTANNNTN